MLPSNPCWTPASLDFYGSDLLNARFSLQAGFESASGLFVGDRFLVGIVDYHQTNGVICSSFRVAPDRVMADVYAGAGRTLLRLLVELYCRQDARAVWEHPDEARARPSGFGPCRRNARCKREFGGYRTSPSRGEVPRMGSGAVSRSRSWRLEGPAGCAKRAGAERFLVRRHGA